MSTSMLSTPRTHHKKHVCKAREYKHASTQAHQARQHVSMRTHQALQHVSTQNFRLVKFYKNVFLTNFVKLHENNYIVIFYETMLHTGVALLKRDSNTCAFL